MTGRARLIAYVTSTALAALVAVVTALPRVDPVPGLVLMLAVFTAERFASVLRDRVAVSVSSIVLLVAVLYGGAALAVVGALGAVPAFALRRAPFRLMRLMFNSGQFVVSAAAAGLAYETAAFLLEGSFPDWRSLLAITIAAAVYCVVNHALVAGVVALTSPDTFLDTFRTIGPSLAMQVPYVGIAVLTVVVVERASWWALLLMGVPAIIARYGLLAFQELDEDYERMVRSFVKAIEIKDLYTRGHSERVSELSVRVAEELGVGYEERRITKYAALLHDVGKIGVPLCIINKPGPLD
ncbi:MAG: HD-GYP domain-containing protein, partial [Nitriliruptoraceae bacterium]